jgi:hypothetical protein
VLVSTMKDYLYSQGFNEFTDENKQEFDALMNLGSALIGAGVGALADGTQGAAVGATAAWNANVYNFLNHHDRAKQKELRAKGDKRTQEENVQLILLDIADQFGDEFLQKANAGTLTEKERANLEIFLNQYAMVEGNEATLKLFQSWRIPEYSYLAGGEPAFPYAGSVDARKAFVREMSGTEPLDFYLFSAFADTRSAERKEFDAARASLGWDILNYPNEELLPTNIENFMEGKEFQTLLGTMTNSALASMAYTTTGFFGASKETQYNATLTASALSDVFMLLGLSRVGLDPVSRTTGKDLGTSSGTAAKERTALLQAAESPFKGQGLTNAGRATTKHPEYFGFSSTEELRAVYRTEAQLNELAAKSAQEILANGIRTTGTGGRSPGGWITYTLPDGRAASWTTSGEFIGFRGVKP